MFLAIFILLLSNWHAAGQTAPFVFSWDKLGCQQDTIQKIAMDASFDSHACLKVCKGSTTVYRVSGTQMANVDYVKWLVVGGKKQDSGDLTSMPITWDDSNSGSIRVTIVMVDASTIVKQICVTKLDPNLIFTWDKIGCQMNKNNVSEIKFDSNFSNASCLRVCKQNKVTYKIYGNDEGSIQTILWTVTGGSAVVVNEKTCSVNWDNTDTGALNIHIVFNNQSVADRTICVDKIESSLVLDWEKIDESAVNQIKYDNSPDNADILLAYPESTVLYKLGGKDLDDVQSVTWNVTGGYVYNPNQYTAIITWEEAEAHSIQINATYQNGTMVSRSINIVHIEHPGSGSNVLNGVQFSFDSAGNQILRSFITLPARHKNPNQEQDSKAVMTLTQSSEYNDISYYPNPVRSELYVTWKNEKGNEVQQLELFDLNGMAIKTFNADRRNDMTVDFDPYPSGIYDLQLVYTDGEKKSLKIIKE